MHLYIYIQNIDQEGKVSSIKENNPYKNTNKKLLSQTIKISLFLKHQNNLYVVNFFLNEW